MSPLELLCQSIEQAEGRRLQAPKDFDLLREHIYVRLRQLISVSTLKRIWGYTNTQSTPSQSTLDVLARYVGYADYDAFCTSVTDIGTIVSNPVMSRHINVGTDLKENDRLLLTWAPNRQCRVRYLGNQQFQVEESQNTRLRAGDYFQCGIIIEGEPLYLANLLQPGRLATNYVCGKQGGIRFEQL